MFSEVEVSLGNTLSDYKEVALLRPQVEMLEQVAAKFGPALKNKSIYMINSTAKGGGVAEMLPRLISLLRQVGADVRWLVLETQDQAFFRLTKKIHNNIHGHGQIGYGKDEASLYKAISQEAAESLARRLKNNNILAIHDPQPLGAGHLALKQRPLPALWRCHIGLDKSNDQTKGAWQFLQPFLQGYQRYLFSAQEYVPDFLQTKSKLLHPAIDPFSHKNRDLSLHKLLGILVNGGLVQKPDEVLTPNFSQQVKRLQSDGSWAEVNLPNEPDIIFRPTIFQVSRWDRLKGFQELMQAFVYLKEKQNEFDLDSRGLRRLNLARLVLAGPDPASIADDPEGLEVMQELTNFYRSLNQAMQKDIIIIQLPMQSAKENALIVNALQRVATVVVQNSIQEGFGLTATEAMYKRAAVLVSNACGLRQQVRDRIDGQILTNAQDTKVICKALVTLLSEAKEREKYALSAQSRVLNEFLVFKQASHWLQHLHSLAT